MSIQIKPSRQQVIDSVTTTIQKLQRLKTEIENTDDYELCSYVCIINSPQHGFGCAAIGSKIVTAVMISKGALVKVHVSRMAKWLALMQKKNF